MQLSRNLSYANICDVHLRGRTPHLEILVFSVFDFGRGGFKKCTCVCVFFDNSGTVLLIWGELFGTMAALLLIFGRAGHLIVHFGVWRSPSSRKDGAILSKMGSHGAPKNRQNRKKCFPGMHFAPLLKLVSTYCDFDTLRTLKK